MKVCAGVQGDFNRLKPSLFQVHYRDPIIEAPFLARQQRQRNLFILRIYVLKRFDILGQRNMELVIFQIVFFQVEGEEIRY